MPKLIDKHVHVILSIEMANVIRTEINGRLQLGRKQNLSCRRKILFTSIQ